MNGWKDKEAAVDSAMSTLLEQHPEIDSIFAYGAVGIDTNNLIVWVLLTGPADSLPERHFPDADSATDDQSATLLAMRDDVRACFAAQSWPAAQSVKVGFDSAERVQRSGGFSYFRG